LILLLRSSPRFALFPLVPLAMAFLVPALASSLQCTCLFFSPRCAHPEEEQRILIFSLSCGRPLSRAGGIHNSFSSPLSHVYDIMEMINDNVFPSISLLFFFSRQ
jgi:hypothetical protein